MAQDASLLNNGRHEQPERVAVVEEVVAEETTAEAATANVEAEVPSGTVALSPNYPNPFQGTTTVTFVAPESGHARMALYDIQGRQIAILFDQVVQADQHERVTIDASNLAVGTYIYTLELGNERVSRQLQVVR